MKNCPVGDELFQADGRTDRHDEANSNFSQKWAAPIRGPYIAPESDLFHYSEVYFTLQTLTIIKRLNSVPTITSIQSTVCLKTGQQPLTK